MEEDETSYTLSLRFSKKKPTGKESRYIFIMQFEITRNGS